MWRSVSVSTGKTRKPYDQEIEEVVMRSIYRESLLKVLGLANMVELDTMGAEAVAMERSLRLLHRWGVLHENPEETWRREELVLEVEERYRKWVDIWRILEEDDPLGPRFSLEER